MNNDELCVYNFKEVKGRKMKERKEGDRRSEYLPM